MNRLDEIVVFNPLGKKEITQIIDLQINDILKRLSDQDMKVSLTPGAKSLIADKGYDPQFGARHLNRTIQKMIEDPLSEEILQGKFVAGSRIRVTKKGETLNFVDENQSDAVDEEVTEGQKA
jgi:ATP-dependent Clp protease ATP-binding subunit ClpC